MPKHLWGNLWTLLMLVLIFIFWLQETLTFFEAFALMTLLNISNEVEKRRKRSEIKD